MAGRLDGKVAIITGGTSGIGRACAIRFAEEGAAVCVAGRDTAAADETVAAIERLGGKAMVFLMDVGEESAHEAMVAACAERFGKVDILVASAGINGWQGTNSREPNAPAGVESLLTIPNNVIHDLISINLLGAFYADRAAARQMLAQGHGGSIVNITSIGVNLPHPGSFYGATKAGVWSLTKTFAVELAKHDIRVNAVAPGFVDTTMTAAARKDAELRAKTVRNVPMKRLGRPEEIANAVLFLASDEGSFITGEQIFAAGGLFVG